MHSAKTAQDGKAKLVENVGNSDICGELGPNSRIRKHALSFRTRFPCEQAITG